MILFLTCVWPYLTASSHRQDNRIDRGSRFLLSLPRLPEPSGKLGPADQKLISGALLLAVASCAATDWK